MNNNRGLIHIYTGEGKGKTTAAVGLATRALGQGLSVCYASFHKRPEKYGYCEIQSLKKLGATILILAKGHPHMDTSLNVDIIKEDVIEGLKIINELIAKQTCDMLIMDEIIISVRDNYLDEAKLIDFMQKKPKDMELVLTGRGATDSMIDLSHYVTRMDKIKHPYDTGIASRKGIEY